MHIDVKKNKKMHARSVLNNNNIYLLNKCMPEVFQKCFEQQ